MDPNYSIKSYEYSGIPLKETSYSSDIIEYINDIIYYGYDYPGHQTERYYIATQALIWEQTSPYKIEFYTERYGYGEYIDVSKEKEEIKSLVQKHKIVPYFSNQVLDYNPISTIKFEDEILNEFILIGTNWNDVTLENNKLVLNNLDNYVGKIEIILKKKTYRHNDAMYYYAEGSQPLVTGGEPSEVIVPLTINIKGGKIKVNKLDSESYLPIKDTNIKFNIINMDTGEYVKINNSQTLSINNEGYLLTDVLTYGEYKIKEISTINGYELSKLSFLIDLNENTISNNNIFDFNFYNDKIKESIEINKVDSTSKLGIKNVEFSLYADEDIVTSDGITHYKKDELVEKGLTNDLGKLIFDNLILGKYYLKETNAPIEYIGNDNIYNFDLKETNENQITVENELKKGSIKLTKYGETYDFKTGEYTNKLLSNIEFELYAKENIIMPDGTKYYSKNEIITSKKTNSKGIINFNDLVLGEYCIKEKSTLDKYVLDTNEYCFNLKERENQEIEITNHLKKFNLKINKIDSESNLPIKSPNIKFSIKNIDSNRYIHINESKEINTNEEGIIYIENLPYGNYEIKELETLSNYILNEETIKIEINDEIGLVNNRIDINFYNQLKKENIEINKIDSLSKLGIKNVEFSLYADEDIVTSDGITHYKKDELVEKGITDNSGKLIFDNLILGKYYLKETNAPIEYIGNNNIYNFDLNEKNENQITVENELKKGSIKLTKYGENYDFKTREYTNKLLSNIEFELYAKENIIMPDGTKYYSKNEIITSKKTNSKGIINFNDLVLGEYCIKEKSTLDKYVLDTNEYCFNLKGRENQEIEIINYLKKFNLKINKLDRESNLPIKSSKIKFSIKNIDSNRYIHINESKEINTNEEGIIYIENLPYGNYEIKELETLPNYILNEEMIKIEINDDTKLIDKTLDVNIYNELKKGSIKIIKKGEIFNFDNLKYETKYLNNVEFDLYAVNDIINQFGIIEYKKDDLITSSLTNELGIIDFNNLYIGSYYIMEKITNENYILDTNKYYFDLNAKQTKEIELVNSLKKNNLTIIKQDSKTKEPIKGVVFEIFNNTTSLGKYTTDKNGKIILKNVPESTYIIKELETKKGYILNDEKIILNLKDNQEIIVENSKKIELPNTMKNDYFKTLFSIVLTLGFGLLIYDKKIYKKN